MALTMLALHAGTVPTVVHYHGKRWYLPLTRSVLSFTTRMTITMGVSVVNVYMNTGNVMDKQEIIDVLSALIEWDIQQGWNQATCWDDLRVLRSQLRREQDDITLDNPCRCFGCEGDSNRMR